MKTYKISMPEDKGIKYEMFRYPAGEMQVRLYPTELSKIKKAERLEVTANIKNGEVMELALLSDALFYIAESGPGARRSLVLPYLPYSRADRRFVDGDCAGLGTFGHMINALGYDTVETFDVHSGHAEKCVEGLINLSPIDHYDQLTPIIKAIGRKGLSLMLPDQGAERYNLTKYKLPILQAGKIRNPKTGHLDGFYIPTIETKKVLIVDDICDGGGTFIGLAKAIHEAYPDVELYLYVSHGIFSKGFDELLDHFEGVFSSNKGGWTHEPLIPD